MARIGTETKGSAVVLVLKPAAILRDKQTNIVGDKAVVKAENALLDKTTSPSYAKEDLKPGEAVRATLYGHKLEVQVFDQFDEPLDAIYEGAAVTEDRGKTPLNQKMTSKGTYVDPVGMIYYANPKFVKKNPTEETNWKNEKPIAMPANQKEPEPATKYVEVGGHWLGPPMAPAIVKRRTIPIPPKQEGDPIRVEIRW